MKKMRTAEDGLGLHLARCLPWLAAISLAWFAGGLSVGLLSLGHALAIAMIVAAGLATLAVQVVGSSRGAMCMGGLAAVRRASRGASAAYLLRFFLLQPLGMAAAFVAGRWCGILLR